MPHGKGNGARTRRKDAEKTLRAEDGRAYSVSTILVCEKTGERTCRGLIHRNGWVTFSGRSFDRMPDIKFNHCTSKFFPPEEKPPAVEQVVPAVPERKPRRATYVEPRRLVVVPDAGQEAPTDGRAEETMTEKQRVRHFYNENHGQRLLAAVEAYAKTVVQWDDTSDVSWAAFAGHAEQDEFLKFWGGDGDRWRNRYENAKYRFSPVGMRHKETAGRVEQLMNKHGYSVKDVLAIVEGTAWALRQQLEAVRPWASGIMEKFAVLFSVSVAYLETGSEEVAKPVAAERLPAPSRLLIVKKPPEQQALPLEGTAEDRALAARMRFVIDSMERLVAKGSGMDHAMLRAAVNHVRGRDPFQEMLDVTLSEQGRKVE